jgi:Uma2 family endonuclease
LIRLPDVSLYLSEPDGEVPAEPPLVVAEILSPDDRLSPFMRKCGEYHSWGVKHIWAADPEDRKLMVYDSRLHLVDDFTIPEFKLTITPAQIFE